MDEKSSIMITNLSIKLTKMLARLMFNKKIEEAMILNNDKTKTIVILESNCDQ